MRFLAPAEENPFDRYKLGDRLIMLTVATTSGVIISRLAGNLLSKTWSKRVSPRVNESRNHRFGGYVNHNSLRFLKRAHRTSCRSSVRNFSSDVTSSEHELSVVQYLKICNETLESLTERFEDLIDTTDHLPEADVMYGDGVLTVIFGKPHGTYVINRQTPNKQIWLSSPKSGPKRYNFINNQWVYRHDGVSLHNLLNAEISAIVKNQARFDECSFSELRQKIEAKMEIMEDGNLVDRVRILLQRDMQYYQEMQTVLREPLCVRISGGKLDFPRHASFAAIKIVTWWEADFVAAFKRASGLSATENGSGSSVDSEDAVIKRIQPSDFILLVVDTAEQLLEHLHMLIQESLDHADLTVLTATLGAAALIRNCLWCYNQHTKGAISSQSSEKINKSYKAFHEMAEAVAERLLDLHCRLISLYILNEADSLSWHSDKPFFERERCSYVIQMWWLYMQGTKADLWNTVSPKMAQRVFSGMLNESLSIITTRFIHGRPTLARSEQFWSDAFNVLCCTGYLSLGMCVDSDEMIGVRPSNLPTAVRDVHAKCNELLVCLLLRGTPLRELYQILRHGLENLAILQPRRGPAPWLLICAPNLLGMIDSSADIVTLSEDKTVILELNIMRHQPQPNWPQLMKVISMNNYIVAKMLLKTFIRQNIGFTCLDNSDAIDKLKKDEKSCNGFLCTGSACDKSLKVTSNLALYSLFHILVVTVNEPEHVIIPALEQDPNWSNYLDRQQVWNQSRPPWLNALVKPLKMMMQPVVEVLLEAAKTGASIYQAMSLAIGCFTELYVTASISVLRTAFALNDHMPAHCRPIGGNVLLQVLCTALYSSLLDVTAKNPHEPPNTPSSGDTSCELSPFNPYDRSTAATVLAEAICSIDEDNKHTAQIDSFLHLVKKSLGKKNENPRNGKLQNMACVIETYTDELLFTRTGRRSLKITYQYLVRASDWVLNNLRCDEKNRQKDLINLPEVSPIVKPLTYIMFHIEDTCFDQFMANYEATNWSKVLTMPLSVTLERVRNQILLRPEFKNIGDLSHEDKEVAQSIKRICSFVRSARFK